MKKVWLAALVAVIASPSLLAQQQPVRNLFVAKVAQKVQQAETQEEQIVLRRMQTLVSCGEEQKADEIKEQALLSFVQAFGSYATKHPGVPAWQLKQLLLSEINSYVDDKLAERLVSRPLLRMMRPAWQQLQLYKAMQYKEEAEEYVQMRKTMDNFLGEINQMNAMGKTYPSNVSQALVFLAEKFFALYELSEGEFRGYENPRLNLGYDFIGREDERFVAKRPELAKAVVRDLNVDVTIGGQTKSLASWARQNSEWEPLAKFADALEGNIY